MRSAVEAATGRAVRTIDRVGGGDINDAYKVQFEDESFGFVKTRADAGPGEYAAEAAGLRWLGEPGALRVPEVLGVSDAVLVLDWVDEGARGDATAFGTGLAAIHAAGADDWGATPARAATPPDAAPRARRRSPAPTRIGRLLLPNDPCPDWPTFYAERRLLPLLPEAGLSARGTRAVEAVCDRIAELAGPPEPPARLHGDLWSGNVHWDRAGSRLADRPGRLRRPPRGRPRDAAAVRPPGRDVLRRLRRAPSRSRRAAQDRVPLYQLFPLLVHAALFGGGYARRQLSALRAATSESRATRAA